jgi:2-polyprenyl-6-methoxyphenol hydroxylase-like FAD-dependent oxidoreductase
MLTVVAADSDIVVIGGGLGGASLAAVMAREGASVTVVERERVYRDRVRGEVIAAWGTAEARRLGLFDWLVEGCAREVPELAPHVEGEAFPPIALRGAAPHYEPSLAFLHPVMQEALIEEAAAAGATILRPARLTALTLGDPPEVVVAVEDSVRTLRARLIVGADGRDSQLSRLAGFQREADPEELLSTGLLVEGEMGTDGAIHYLFGRTAGHSSAICEVSTGLYRVYLFRHTDAAASRLSGSRDFETTLVNLREAGVPDEWLTGAQLRGPLATFDGSHRWIERPHRDGIVLVGDAAAASDPAWGSGLGRTLRDVRLLRDVLLADADWHTAADAYAEQHDEYWERLRDAEHLSAAALMSAGPDGIARRNRAFEIFDAVPELETWTHGPEAHCDDDVRAQLLAPA